MEKRRLIFRMRRHQLAGRAVLWFNSAIHHLEIGEDFRASHWDISVPPEDDEEHQLYVNNSFKPIIKTLEKNNFIRFATVLDPYMRLWYERKAAEQKAIPWLEIGGYDEREKIDHQTHPLTSIQIKDVIVSPGIDSSDGLDWLTMEYFRITKVHFDESLDWEAWHTDIDPEEETDQ